MKSSTTIEELTKQLTALESKVNTFESIFADQGNRYALIIGAIAAILAGISYARIRWEINRLEKTQHNFTLEEKKRLMRFDKIQTNLHFQSSNFHFNLYQNNVKKKKLEQSLFYLMSACDELCQAALILRQYTDHPYWTDRLTNGLQNELDKLNSFLTNNSHTIKFKTGFLLKKHTAFFECYEHIMALNDMKCIHKITNFLNHLEAAGYDVLANKDNQQSFHDIFKEKLQDSN